MEAIYTYSQVSNKGGVLIKGGPGGWTKIEKLVSRGMLSRYLRVGYVANNRVDVCMVLQAQSAL